MRGRLRSCEEALLSGRDTGAALPEVLVAAIDQAEHLVQNAITTLKRYELK